MVQLYIANEIGREVVNSLGELGLVQFRDVRQTSLALSDHRRLDGLLLFKTPEQYINVSRSSMAMSVPSRELSLKRSDVLTTSNASSVSTSHQ